MDPKANKVEQLQRAHAIIDIVDQCDTVDGSFTHEQLESIAEHAQRLAELVEALARWERGQSKAPYQKWVK